MRPDEHKKKRSAQYKKKHGMSKDEQTKDSRQPKSRSTSGRGKVKVDQKSQGKTSGSHVGGAVKLPPSSSDSDTSDNDQESVTVKKTFRRREVVSNWERYEILPPDTETTQKKGEDFLNLLNTAGGTSSQFRFKEEEDWDEGPSVSTDTKLLAVDLSDLTASLQCIPLYQRLGVEQSLFSPEQIQGMTDIARENTQQYQPKPVSHTELTTELTTDRTKPSYNTSDQTVASPPNITGTESDQSDCTKQCSNRLVDNERIINIVTDHQGDVNNIPRPDVTPFSTGRGTCVDSTTVGKSPVVNIQVNTRGERDSVNTRGETDSMNTKAETDSVNTRAKTESVNTRAETDSVRGDAVTTSGETRDVTSSGETRAVTSSGETHAVTSSGETHAVTSSNLDDDLDFLLSLDNPSDVTGRGETTQQNSVQRKATPPPHKTQSSVTPTGKLTGSEKETENLEDWLDSVLD